MTASHRLWSTAFAALTLALSLQAGAVQVVVGEVAPLSGLDATQGRAYSIGMKLCFDEVNRLGGVNGHKFTLALADDGGRSADTVAATRKLLADTPPMVLAGYFGNESVSALVASGILEKDRIALVGYRTNEVRAETPMVYNVRAGLREEIGKIADHVATIGIKRVGLFYEDGPNAPALLAAVDEAARKAGITVTAKTNYAAGRAKVGPAVETLLAAQPQAILIVASGAAAAAFIEQYRNANGAAQLFAHSGADIEQLSKRLGDSQMQGVAIAQVTPSPYKISGKLTKEFGDLAARAKTEVPVSYAMMEGYIAARVIVEAVRRMGAKPTREGMPAAIEGIDNLDLGGYLVAFRPGSRSGSRYVELSIINGEGRIRQ